MLRALKEKAKRDSIEPQIDMSIVLSEGKMKVTPSATQRDVSVSAPTVAVPISVASIASSQAMTSSESSSCSIATQDGDIVDSSGHFHRHGQRFGNSGESPSDSQGMCTPQFREMQGLHTTDSANVAIATASTSAMADEHAFERPSKKPRLEEAPVLLGRDDEDSALPLKPLHAFIRQQIEVFSATPLELNQPAPGRKQAIQLGQVGIRCRHCSHLPVRNRVKRAVCYPSKVKKLYHSVSDMKFAHFTACQELPADLRVTFNALKEEALAVKASGRKPQKSKGEASCSTAKYYEESARLMGMIDGNGGIFMSQTQSGTASVINDTIVKQTTPIVQRLTDGVNRPFHAKKSMPSPPFNEYIQPKEEPTPKKTNPSATILAAPQDIESLNPLHCFVRNNLELFAADEADVAAPAPGRKTRVVLGQVGIRCIHCAKLPAKERVKRAVCYPPNVQGVYHAVSNMKFDHFGICPSLPVHARAEFDALRNTTVRRGVKKNSDTSKSGRSSTSDYYEKAALAKGLADSGSGIRFASAPLRKEQAKDYHQAVVKASALTLSGLSALAMAACHAV